MVESIHLSEDEINQIKMVNDAASKAAAAALTKMLNKNAKVTYPSLSLKPIEAINSIDLTSLLAISDVSGDLRGSVIILHPLEHGLRLVDYMMANKPGTLKEVNDEVVSAYQEFVNIVAGAYLSNLANFLGFKIFPNPPKFTGQMKKVKDDISKELDQDVGKLLLVKTQFEIEEEKMPGDFFIIFDEESLLKIVNTIRDQSS